MGKKIDLTGQTFSNLFVIKFLCINNRNKSYYLCRCTCGKEKPVRIDHLRSGKTTSCGHVGNQHSVESCTTHKLSYNPLYFVWYQMMTRCYNKKFQDYHNYGGRGIEVCAEWFDISKFVFDMSDGYKAGLQLDRIDNDKWYSKENCRWATRKENNRNKRTNLFVTIMGETLTMIEWSEKTGIGYGTLISRYKRKITGLELITPVKK